MAKDEVYRKYYTYLLNEYFGMDPFYYDGLILKETYIFYSKKEIVRLFPFNDIIFPWRFAPQENNAIERK